MSDLKLYSPSDYDGTKTSLPGTSGTKTGSKTSVSDWLNFGTVAIGAIGNILGSGNKGSDAPLTQSQNPDVKSLMSNDSTKNMMVFGIIGVVLLLVLKGK